MEVDLELLKLPNQKKLRDIQAEKEQSPYYGHYKYERICKHCIQTMFS